MRASHLLLTGASSAPGPRSGFPYFELFRIFTHESVILEPGWCMIDRFDSSHDFFRPVTCCTAASLLGFEMQCQDKLVLLFLLFFCFCFFFFFGGFFL